MNRQQKRAKKRRKQKGRPLDKYKPDAKSVNLAWDVFKLISFTVLHDKYGFEKDTLEEFNAKMQSGLDSVTGGFVSIYDLNETLIKEAGIAVIERDRYKQKWKVANYEH